MNLKRRPRRRPRVLHSKPPRQRARPGFTLLELMVVTVVMGILITVAIGPLIKARERGMIAAVKQEMSNSLKAIAMFDAEHSSFPTNLSDLEEYGVSPGPQIKVCAFNATTNYVQIQFQHQGSKIRVESRYPVWDRQMRETANKNCTDIRAKKAKKKKK